jgi:integrase
VRRCYITMGLTAIHPGEHLAEELETLGMSAAELARKIGVRTNRVTLILHGTRAIKATRLSASDTSSESEINADAVFKLGAQQNIDKAVRRWVKRSEIGKKIFFHNARHAFATLSLTNRVDIDSVSKLRGHKSLETTEIYAKVIGEKKRQAVRMLPRLNGNGRGTEGGEL